MLRPRAKTRSWAAVLRDRTATESNVRASAVADLAAHVEDHRDEVVEHLLTALSDDAAEVRAAAAFACADANLPETLEALIAASDDDDLEVVGAALTALGELRRPEALPTVRKHLRHAEGPIRFQAVIAFPRVCEDRDEAVEVLLRATSDDDAFVRHIALRMAEELGGDPTGDDPVDPRFIKRARALLDDERDAVRVAAAVILGRAGRRDGATLLAQVAGREVITREADDESAAIELCGELGIEAAREALRKRGFGRVVLVQRDPFAWQARVALATMGDTQARTWIVKELDAWTKERRGLAVAAAGRARLSGTRSKLKAMREAGRADAHTIDEALALIDAHDAIDEPDGSQ